MPENPAFDLKFYLNGFPKSGLHLLTGMTRVIAAPIECDDYFTQPWAGTFYFDAWGNAWMPLEQVTYRIARLQNRQFVKAHAGYLPDLERFLWYSCIATIFVYRDFRDVAVSQAYHILNESEDFHHPAKERFMAMDSFDEVLEAVIVGVGPFAGVMDRWKYYSGWLDVTWVHKIKFEEMIEDRTGVARRILDYGLNRAASIWGTHAQLPEDQMRAVAARMVEHSENTDESPTFRKGKVGDWKDHFTARHKRLFKETDKGWLKILGYEQGDDW